MAAYASFELDEFISQSETSVLGVLQQAYASDGFLSQYTRQTKAWNFVIPKLTKTFSQLVTRRSEARAWTVLLEYPLYRLRRRIDVVVLTPSFVVVVECKVGSDTFSAEDRRQVEEYALDLRDFHAKSRGRRIVPVLWSTNAVTPEREGLISESQASVVDSVVLVGAEDLQVFFATLSAPVETNPINAKDWNNSPYRPVPAMIEAATNIFSGHNVRSIANADADNLRAAAARLVALIAEAHSQKKRYLLVLTGVPGSGKTLAGLDVVHSALTTGVEHEGDIVYLSGNTPLVVVLREALARDECARARSSGANKSLAESRSAVRTRIQHINDFLQQSLIGARRDPPHHLSGSRT